MGSWWRQASWLAWPLAASAPARAEFAAAVSPPRFELDAEPGKTIRKVIEITHVSPNEGSYRFQTMDWRFSPKGELEFIEDLAPDSCRPWVAIERRTATVAPRGKLRYRFEITPPEGTPAMECRFALMIEDAGEPTRVGPMGIPMTARIGVIVYARVGGVKPELRIEQQLTAKIDGVWVPALRVTNTGSATGRLSGFLNGRDGAGQRMDLAPASSPILPGMSALIGLMPSAPVDRPGDPPRRSCPGRWRSGARSKWAGKWRKQSFR